MAYQDFKDLTRTATSDKYCVKKHLILLKTKYMMSISSTVNECIKTI